MKTMISRRLIYMTVIPLFFVSCQNAQADLFPLQIGDQLFLVEVADSPAERQQGLMYRRTLESDRGMLFIFEDSDFRSFWMKNTYIDLSIAYIDEQWRIIDILDMYALDESSVPSSRPAKYALELNRGAFERHGVFEGDRLDLSTVPGTE